ncbi:pilus assembly protein PilW [Photobacterium angustum]|uniref:PilW family protein n=1 Tax=Photobacterium angustum TaxID=661 RepID=UPI0005E508AF|nr:prepilin-type N-terminal cleavage/methylation domain-containing protein [Photobacterium angustum]KJF95029.1 pilus assembly protein PilW [Photobacterium angustum]KJG06334.1 pilus assembly protein PilW [Photobacterium angustum]PSV91969.1 prepilin-type N-terminal cleavage/methylation domain-containing protein [Photobacterium angustum]PSW79329.1 prepilin-type N-terminal cleavage/methylation domain-containing protein [Photobacterium angustum]
MNNAKGFSLIELLISSAVGLLAIGIVGSVFLSGHNAANKRSLELMLQQDVNDALRSIKEDVLRAGYVSGGSSSLKISGASETVYINPSNNCLAYTYQDKTGTQKYYSIYYKDENKIVYKELSSAIDTTTACSVSYANSLIYEKIIKVIDFNISSKVVSSSSATSQYITMTLKAEVKNNTLINTEKFTNVKVRNWQ